MEQELPAVLDNTENATEDEQLEETAENGQTNSEESWKKRYGQRTKQYNLRPRRKPAYNIKTLMSQIDVTTISPKTDVAELTGMSSGLNHLAHIMMTQYGMHKGLKMFGDRGDKAIQKEMQQLHDRKVMDLVNPSQLCLSLIHI